MCDVYIADGSYYAVQYYTTPAKSIASLTPPPGSALFLHQPCSSIGCSPFLYLSLSLYLFSFSPFHTHTHTHTHKLTRSSTKKAGNIGIEADSIGTHAMGVGYSLHVWEKHQKGWERTVPWTGLYLLTPGYILNQNTC